MDSLNKWLGPGAIVGGLGAAMLCGAGMASADTGADSGPGTRGPQASASASDAGDSGAAKPARMARSAPSGVASARLTAAQTPAARADAPSALPSAITTPSNRVAAASVKVRTSDNTPPAALASPRPAAAVSPAPAAAVSPTPAAAIPAPAASAPAPAAAAAAAAVVPSSIPVDPAKFAGTYYEQGSVKQFFSIGLVNTKAVYTAKPNGTLGVRNSGNYFFKWGPKSSITGSAVPVNATNTALNVGFGGTPSSNPPGNYLIIDRAPDYSWAIVSDPSGRSGYILTRSKTIDPQEYQRLLAKARELGVTGRITPTRQFT